MKGLVGTLGRGVAGARANKPRYLFVTGCPRSGTTALWQLLVSHPQIVLGVERYGNRFFGPEFLDPSLFEFERFFHLEPGDTFYSDLAAVPEYEEMRGRFERARYRGDKIPYLTRFFPELDDEFGDRLRVIVITRDLPSVASSYQRRHDDGADQSWPDQDALDAVRDWRQALEATSNRVIDPRYLVVSHERLLEEGTGLGPLLSFLELEPAPEMLACYEWLKAMARRLATERPEVVLPADVSAAIDATLANDRYRAMAVRVAEVTV